jgi:5-deoxy-5-amino-3-dehydroquinate synthase
VKVVKVDLGERTYEVLIGPGARRLLSSFVPPIATRAAVVTQKAVGVEVDTGVEQETFFIEDGEGAKSMATVERLCRSFARFGLSRADVVVGVGGGVVADVAGFAAAVYHRGVAVVHVATTLLAQVDAAIGGKTGVNLPEGKNLVGAFWQPVGVICDTEVLSTLPSREYRSGLGEMAKYAFLGVASLPELPLEEAVAACAECKARFVAGDEREVAGLSGAEAGGRALLNYGHTLGHALETAGNYDLRHGEAVAIGLVFAAHLAHRLGRVSKERVDEHERVVASYGLPSRVPQGAKSEDLLALMVRDKKSTGMGLTFVLDGPVGLEVVRDVPEAMVLATLEGLR